MSIERGEIFKIGTKEFAVMHVDVINEKITLAELKPHDPEDRVVINLSAKALGVLLKEHED